MKDAKGHGSNPRSGAHSSGVEKVGQSFGRLVGVPPDTMAKPVEPFGQPDPPSRYSGASVPNVDWSARDLQDSAKRVNEDTVLRDYVPKDQQNEVQVYASWIPAEDMPREKLVEEEDNDPNGYDWSEYSARGTFPPAKVEVDKNGKASIVDGNHRVRYWQEQGRSHIPAYVIDHRPNVQREES
jgi:hypothetical protein